MVDLIKCSISIRCRDGRSFRSHSCLCKVLLEPTLALSFVLQSQYRIWKASTECGAVTQRNSLCALHGKPVSMCSTSVFLTGIGSYHLLFCLKPFFRLWECSLQKLSTSITSSHKPATKWKKHGLTENERTAQQEGHKCFPVFYNFISFISAMNFKIFVLQAKKFPFQLSILTLLPIVAKMSHLLPKVPRCYIVIEATVVLLSSLGPSLVELRYVDKFCLPRDLITLKSECEHVTESLSRWNLSAYVDATEGGLKPIWERVERVSCIERDDDTIHLPILIH